MTFFITLFIVACIVLDAITTALAMRWKLREMHPLLAWLFQRPGGTWWLLATHSIASGLVVWGKPHGAGGIVLAVVWALIVARNVRNVHYQRVV